MTSGAGASIFRRQRTSIPLGPGRFKSSRTTSGANVRASQRALLPWAAPPTSSTLWGSRTTGPRRARPLGERGGDAPAPPCHRAHGGDELVRRALFGQKSRRAGANRANRVLLFGVHGEDENGKLRVLSLELTEELEAASSGHLDVENDGVPSLALDELPQLGGRRSLAPDEDVVRLGQYLAQPAAHHRVIV